MISVTRKYRFSASHRLHVNTLSEAENWELYGKCNNPYGHGHNYEIAVTVSGPLDARSGRAVDLALLDSLVERQVLDPFDHRDLNAEVEAFRALVPTSENLGREVIRRLKQNWSAVFPADGPRLESIAIAETSRNAFRVSAHEIA
jgi:6-pyruvoyltetrahydropterin/6-carboxytetrahydropterin synthase